MGEGRLGGKEHALSVFVCVCSCGRGGRAVGGGRTAKEKGCVWIVLLAGAVSQSVIKGLLRELNPGPLAPEARIIPLDQAAGQH